MKLYDPSKSGSYVYAIAAKAAKEGTPPTFQAVNGLSFEDCEHSIHQRNSRTVYPYPIGKYDELGRFETYCPPVDGIRLGKFVLHPLAQNEYLSERDY